MKAYLINLDSRPDRLDHFNEQAVARGFDAVRISAVDGADPEISAVAKTIRPVFTKDPMGVYAYACFKSHRLAWQKICDSSEDYGFVFEDDVILADDFAKWISSTNWIPGDADVVKLETFATRVHLDKKPSFRGEGRQLHRLRSKHLGAGAYLLSKGAAEHLLETTEDFSDPVDQVLFNPCSPFFKSSLIYQMVPAPAIQGNRSKAKKGEWAVSSLMADRLQYAGISEGTAFKERALFRLRVRLENELAALWRGTVYRQVSYQ